MIPIEVLKQVSVLYTHAKCPDGLASAMILKDAFRMLGMAPRIEFLVHNSEEHRQAGLTGRALFCDIAPTAGVADMTTIGPHIVLDHHIGAKDIVLSFNERANGDIGVFAHEDEEPGVSGAVLAFREVWVHARNEAAALQAEWDFASETAVRDFAECTGARDTWQTKDPRFLRGQWGSKMLMAKPVSYWLATEENPYREHDPKFAFNHPPYLTKQEIAQGEALWDQHVLAVRQTYDQKVVMWVDRANPRDHSVCLMVFQEQVAGHRLTSDVAELIRTELHDVTGPTLIVGFSFVVDTPGAEPHLLYSLRQANGFDVCAFAKAEGGGGHTKAAGFSVPLPECGPRNPYEDIRNRLRAFLRA